MDILGIPITVIDFLPETVKDKDGKENKLLGVMLSGKSLDDPFDTAEHMAPKIVLLIE